MEHLSVDVADCPSFTPSKDQRLRYASKVGHPENRRLEMLFMCTILAPKLLYSTLPLTSLYF